MALDALGDRERALHAARRHAAPARRRTAATGPGYVLPRRACNWPVEHTTYTAAAVILAVDALVRRAHAGLRTSCAAPRWPPDFAELGLECGCAPSGGSADRVAGVAARHGVAPASSRAPRPRRSRRSRAPAGRRRYGGRPPSAGSGKTSWITSSAAGHHPAAPSRCSRCWACSSAWPPSMNSSDSGVRQQRRRPWSTRPTTATTWSSSPASRDGAAEHRQRVHQPELRRRPATASWCSQPAWFSSEPRWWSTVNDGAADLAGGGAEVDRRLAAVGADLERRTVRGAARGATRCSSSALVLGHEALGRAGVGEQVGGHRGSARSATVGAPVGWRRCQAQVAVDGAAPRARSGSRGRCRTRAGRRAARRTRRLRRETARSRSTKTRACSTGDEGVAAAVDHEEVRGVRR